MGFRFRKSFKIAPGVKLNINKKSFGLTIGKRGAHYTINSKGKRTTSIGIPGTGLSYTSTSGGRKKKKVKKSTTKNYTSKQYTTVSQNTPNITQSTKANLSPETKTLYHYIYLIAGIFLIIWGLLKAIFTPGFILFALLGLYLVKKSRQYTNGIEQDNTMQGENKQSENINILDGAQNMNEVSHRLNIPTYIRQLEETITLIQNSKNADTVVSRLQFLESLRDKLKATSYSELDNVINSINEVLDDKISLINMAIQRNLDSELEKIRELKTEKGRLNRLSRFFEAMRAIENLPSENISFIEQLEQKTQID